MRVKFFHSIFFFFFEFWGILDALNAPGQMQINDEVPDGSV